MHCGLDDCRLCNPPVATEHPDRLPVGYVVAAYWLASLLLMLMFALAFS